MSNTNVISVLPGTGAAALGKVTGGAATAADVGMAMLALRDDALATLAQAEGQYTHLRVNAEGALHVVTSGGGAGAAVVVVGPPSERPATCSTTWQSLRLGRSAARWTSPAPTRSRYWSAAAT